MLNDDDEMTCTA